MSFQRRYNIPYLYGLIKTHKVPFGWRFISGGTDLAMNLIGDWMHASLSGLLDETHHLASKAMSGAWSQDPVPCLESFIIRDSRDVVRRIRDFGNTQTGSLPCQPGSKTCKNSMVTLRVQPTSIFMSWAAFICSPPEGMDAAAVAAAIRTRFTEDEVDGHESSLKSLCEWLEMADM